MAEQKDKPAQKPALNLNLVPVEHSDQPKVANFTRVTPAPGMVYLDFGFLEPGALAALAEAARAGGKLPQSLDGKLAVRVALGYDTLAQLHQQLGQVVAGLKAAGDRAKAARANVGKDTAH